MNRVLQYRDSPHDDWHDVPEEIGGWPLAITVIACLAIVVAVAAVAVHAIFFLPPWPK